MAPLRRSIRLLNVRQLEELPIGPLEGFCGAARIAVARPEEITWIRVGQRPQLVANFVRDDDINSYACLGAIEEDLVVAILVRREPLSFQRGWRRGWRVPTSASAESRRGGVAHDAHCHCHLRTRTCPLLLRPARTLWARSSRLARHPGVFGFLSASIGFLRSMSFATQKAKKECIRSCLRCVVASPLFQVDRNSVRSMGRI